MYRIPPIEQPRELARAVSDLATIGYPDLSGEAKQEIWGALFAAQNGRCAYCEVRLVRGHTKIEHFHPQNSGKISDACVHRINTKRIDRADLAWGNLLLCCTGHEGAAPGEQTCDTRKGGVDICDRFYTPRNLPAGVEMLVRVEMSGRLTVTYCPGDTESGQRVIDDVLNLNCRTLVDARMVAFGRYQQALRKKMRHDASTHHGASRAAIRRKWAQWLRGKCSTVPHFATTVLSVADAEEHGGRS